jgi:endo-1,4-beta-xylanase
MISSPFRHTVLLGLSLISASVLHAQNTPVIVQAESGQAGADWSAVAIGGVAAISIQTSSSGQNPGSAPRVASYSVTFPQAGTWELYAHVYVGAGVADDDSFFYGNGFGTKAPATDADWVLVNNLAGVGYSTGSAIVGGEGIAPQGVWKWIKLSAFNGGGTPVTFTVGAGALTQTFQIGGREDGLSIDQFAFGPSGVQFTVTNLDLGQAGTPAQPPLTFPGGEVRSGLPLATGKAKYLGSVHSTSQLGTPGTGGFTNYFNQVTPENAGKWGSVEGARDVMDWTQLDAAYDFAKSNGFPFKMHTLVWGAQQPGWIASLPPAEQLEEIREWFMAVAARYPDIDSIDVVNEPIRQPPNTVARGNYVGALGGPGATGWDWVINAFRMAREIFPASTKLILNEYSVTNDTPVMQQYVNIVELLQAEDLIDIVGVQAHAFSTTVSATTTRNNLNLLASTGVPITASEFDIDGPSDQIQLDNYRRVFPVFWEHPAVIGVTLWGYRPGLWRDAQGAALVRADSTEKPAMDWLVAYVTNNPPEVTPAQLFALPSGATNGTSVGSVAATDADAGTTLSDWRIAGGPSAALFSIASGTGELTVANSAGLNFTPGSVHEIHVTVADALTTSAQVAVRVVAPSANGLPLIILNPATQAVYEGEDATFTVEAVSTTALSYQWRKGGANVVGATGATLSIEDAQQSDEGIYTVVVTNSTGDVESSGAVLTVDTIQPPAITSQPLVQTAVVGAQITFSVTATGYGPITYQWKRDGVNISGATGASYTISTVEASNGGSYTVVVTNPAGSATSNAAALTIDSTPRLINLSTRSITGAGESTLIMGFYIAGTGSKTLLIRGIGPELQKPPFNVPSVVADPSIAIYKDNTLIESNNDWAPSLAPDFVRMGAFALTNGSKDAALLVTLPAGGYTVHLVNPGPVAEALVEIYDYSRDVETRLVNLSCRLNIGTGQTVIIGTYLLAGTQSVLVRNAGPALTFQFPTLLPASVVLPDPRLTVYAGQTSIAENNDWNATLAPAFLAAGAFAFENGSKDAAIRVPLNPGGYTVHATGTGNGGIALVELYESP